MSITWSRLRRAAVITPVALAAAVASVASAAPDAAAATTPAGWHIAKTFAPGSTIFSVAGLAANDGWLTGATGNGRLIVEHWNGRNWGSVPTPASLDGFAGQSVVAGAGKTVWAFDNQGNSTDNAVALRRTTRGWVTHKFPNWSVVNAAAVFGPANAWEFGEIFVPKLSPFVRRFNGKAWTNVRTPIVPTDASAVSASDIWAVGQTVASLDSRDQVFTAAQWTHGKWRLLHFPKLRLPKGVAVMLPHVVALGPANVWVDLALQKGMGAYPGAILLHFDGRKWTQVSVPYKGTFMMTNLATDGKGGIWIAATTNDGATQDIYHLRGGRWSRSLAPSVRGDGTQVQSIAWRPGTTQAWAAGDMVPNKGGETQGVLLSYRS
jgi:hypothetical protein